MRGTRITFDDLVSEVESSLRLRILDLLDSVVFQDERDLDVADVTSLTDRIIIIEAAVEDYETRIAALEAFHP